MTKPHDRGSTAFRRLCSMLVASGALLAAFAAPAQAAAGDLDPSFSVDGKTTTNFSGNSDEILDIALQPDGRIVAVGPTRNDADNNDFAVARYRANGKLDKTFSGDGKTTRDFDGDSDTPRAVAVQPDGKIVVAGPADVAGSTDVGIVRFKPNGALDNTFSDDGMQTTAFAASERADAVLIQPDGKIVVAGTEEGLQSKILLARYNANGDLDQAFSGDGKTTTSFPGGDVGGSGAALRPDGKIVVAGGFDSDTGPGDFAFARYKANGGLDTSFGDSGRKTIDFEGGNDFASDVALQPSGEIVAAGQGDRADGSGDFGVVRLSSNGAPDPTFSGDGKTRTDLGGDDRAQDVALAGDGKIVVGGWPSPTSSPVGFATARYKPNGAPDNTFSEDGTVLHDFAPGNERGGVVAVQPDGRIIQGGLANSPSDFAIERLLGG